MNQRRTARNWRGLRARMLSVGLAGALALSAAGWGGAPAPVSAQDDLVGRTAQIAGSEDGVNLRAEPKFGSEIVGTLADGTTVELRIDAADTVLDADGETRWWPIRFDGVDGWVAGYYLNQDVLDEDADASDDEAASSEDEPTASDEADAADEADATDGADVFDADAAADPTEVPDAEDDAEDGDSTDVFFSGETVLVSAEDGANFRAEANTESEVLNILAFGTPVELRIDAADTVVRGGVRWWPVRFDGEDGWIAGDYLQDGDGAAPETDDDGIDESAGFALGTYVSADIADGVNVRTGAGTENEQIATIRVEDVVQVMDGPIAADGSVLGWYLVTDGEFTGYVDGDLLAVAGQPAAPSDDADPVQEPEQSLAQFSVGDIGRAHREGTNVRSGASRDSGIVGTLDPGMTVEIISEAVYDDRGDDWYLITDGAMTGYANGSFLGTADGATVDEEPEAAPEPDPEPAPAPDPSLPIAGQAVGAFEYPLESYVFTQAYGCSPFVFEPYDANLGCNFHNGIDLAANAYTPLLAADGGVVKYAGWCDCGLGFYVEIDHGNGFSTVYGHMVQQPDVFTGQAVAQGDVLGGVGSTGLSTGPHVHFMIKLSGSTVDPLAYLPELAG